MSKAVLVMNMPETCSECRLFSADYGCAIIGSVGRLERGRPEDCRLKPMPEKKVENYRSEFARGIKKGWNDAIKAIEPE